MATIVPTILAENSHQYREQLERVSGFARRIHIDLADKIFAPTKTIDIEDIWFPDNAHVDLHIMHIAPAMELKIIEKLKPSLVIVHAEAEGNFVRFADRLHDKNIKAGVALLPETNPKKLKKAIAHIDHVLIFSGDLGHFGGSANLELLKKVKQLRRMKPGLEIGWDGGVNESNVAEIASAGVNVLNVGGYIQRAEDSLVAYEHLKSLLH